MTTVRVDRNVPPGLPRRSAKPAPGQLCLLVVGGPDTGAWVPLLPGTTEVGRQAPIRLTDQSLSQPHFRLTVGEGTQLALEDRGSRGGTTVDGVAVSGRRPLEPGSVISAGGTRLAVAIAPSADAALTPAGDGTLDFYRPPRLRVPVGFGRVAFPSDPRPPNRAPVQLFAMLTPVLAAAAMALIAHQVVFLAIAGLTPLMGVGTLVTDRHRGRSSHRRQLDEYRQRLDDARSQLDGLLRDELRSLRDIHPDPGSALLRALMPSSRVWERRREDDDFLTLRVGTGAVPASVEVSGVPPGPGDAAPLLHDAPVTLSLRSWRALGIAGPRPLARELARAIVATAATFQSPRDLAITVLTGETAGPDWEWVRWLPHCRPEVAEGPHVRVGNDPATIAARVSELSDLLGGLRAEGKDRRPSMPRLLHLVVLDGSYGLRQRYDLGPLIDEGPSHGIHFICIDDSAPQLPEGCRAVCDLGAGGDAAATLRRAGEANLTGIRPDRLSAPACETLARALAPLRDTGAVKAGGRLPASVRLLELLGIDPPAPAGIESLWRAGRTTGIPIGRDADGPFLLDLAQGPHLLVGGTTGAGKSELLQTIVASLAAHNRPDQMVFVLIDYKGGAAFRGCVDLPHTVGMVTDLDTASVERALVSLRAELQRRKAVLDAADQPDILRYWAAIGGGRGADPLPRLVLVVDEFKTMAEAMPEQLKALVDIAAQGRSLGVHLILATQRPAGAVTGDMRANVNLSICLRVATTQDSLDVIGAPDAAELSVENPGRAYLRVGTARPELFQVARVGGPRPGERHGAVPLEVREVRWSELGRPLPVTAPPHASADDSTDLSALVDAIRGAASHLGAVAPAPPWQPPLPEVLPLAALGASPPLHLAFGRADLPREQRQVVATYDIERQGHLLVAGAPRSGRTTLLRTLAAAATATPTGDLHLYAIDCGGGGLAALTALPQCGAVVTPADPDRVERLLNRLHRELTARLQQLTAAGCSDLGELRAREPGAALPYFLVLIDRYDSFVSQLESFDGGKLVAQLQRLLQDGLSPGFRLVLTGDRTLVTGRVGGMVEGKLMLRMADRLDYSVAGLSARGLPVEICPGRAFRVPSGDPIQIAHVGGSPDGAAQTAALRELAGSAAAPPGRGPFRVDPLPASIGYAQALHLPRRGDGALAGVGGDELSQVRLSAPVVLVLGQPGSGRSTALAVMVRSLAGEGREEVVVITPRRSRLPELLGPLTGVRLFGPTELDSPDLVRCLDEAGPFSVVVIDDADALGDLPLAARLAQLLSRWRDGGATVLAAAGIEEAAGAFRGLVPELRKAKSGLLLQPQQVTQGDLLGTRLQRSMVGAPLPLRAVAVHQGVATVVQVPVPV
ncbi:MAG: FtsK/SpoIIIE domain-containing protein [Candidatus Dormibacteria bacterium]